MSVEVCVDVWLDVGDVVCDDDGVVEEVGVDVGLVLWLVVGVVKQGKS